MPQNRPSWRSPRILSTLSLVFLCGAIVGAVAMSPGAHKWMHKPAPSWKEGGKEISLQRFKKELDLRPEQAAQLETILDDFTMYYRELQTQMDEVRSSGKNRIVRILNEEQKQKFGKMMGALQEKQLR